MNQSNLIGRLTREPELRYTQSGDAVASFTLAVQRSFKNADGEYDADFISCVAWKGTAEFVANHADKGLRLAVSGRLQSRYYENKEGNTVYVTELIAEQVTPIDWKEQADDNKENKGKAGQGSKGGNQGKKPQGKGNNRR